MSAISKLPFMAGTLSLGAAIAAIATIPSLRERLDLLVSPTFTRSALKAILLFLAAINIKNLPLVWHWRVFKGIIYQIYFQPIVRTPKTLFAPMITSSYNSLYDTDYNLHKSNSTYFADLDVARAHYASSVIRTGLKRLNAGDEIGLPDTVRGVKGRYYLALGGVACYFHKEVPMMKGFEIYTRLLSWDRKWLYLVSHVVMKGKVTPEGYSLQPWKKIKKSKKVVATKEGEDDWKKYIYASSVARYVLKKGRLTINPEIVLERSRLLPPRPEGLGYPPRSEVSANGTPATNGTPALSAQENTKIDAAATVAAVSTKLDSSANVNIPGEEPDWTWDDMETERLRGLKMASHFDALGGLHDELRVGEALGEYSDWF